MLENIRISYSNRVSSMNIKKKKKGISSFLVSVYNRVKFRTSYTFHGDSILFVNFYAGVDEFFRKIEARQSRVKRKHPRSPRFHGSTPRNSPPPPPPAFLPLSCPRNTMIYLRPVLYPRGTILSPLARFRTRIKNFFLQEGKGFIALTRNYDFKHPANGWSWSSRNDIETDHWNSFYHFSEKGGYTQRGICYLDIVLFIFLLIFRNTVKRICYSNEKGKYNIKKDILYNVKEIWYLEIV